MPYEFEFLVKPLVFSIEIQIPGVEINQYPHSNDYVLWHHELPQLIRSFKGTVYYKNLEDRFFGNPPFIFGFQSDDVGYCLSQVNKINETLHARYSDYNPEISVSTVSLNEYKDEYNEFIQNIDDYVDTQQVFKLIEKFRYTTLNEYQRLLREGVFT